MQSIYSIRINLDSEEKSSTVSEILNIEPSKPDLSAYLIREIIEKKSDDYFDFINEFLDIVEPKLNEL